MGVADKMVMAGVFMALGGAFAWVIYHACTDEVCPRCQYPYRKCVCDPWEIDLEQNVERAKRRSDRDL